MSELSKQFEFRYGGENFIDLNTLLTSQFHFLATINELQKELYPQLDLKIKVGSPKQGSFVLDLLFETKRLQEIFTLDNAAVLVAIVEAFGSLIELRRFLEGGKADVVTEVGADNISVSVSGKKNKVIVDKRVFNIYQNNGSVNRAMEQNFEMLSDDPEIESVTLSESGKNEREILKVEAEEFETLSRHNSYLDRSEIDMIHRNQVLFIKEANLHPEKGRVWKWKFFHRNRDISAKILDTKFAEKINSGYRLGQGDHLVADLRIFSKFSQTYNSFIESGKYEIVQVHEVVHREDQGSLDF